MTTHAPKLPLRRKPRPMKTSITQNYDASDAEQNNQFIDSMISKKVEHAERNLTSNCQQQSTSGNSPKPTPT